MKVSKSLYSTPVQRDELLGRRAAGALSFIYPSSCLKGSVAQY